MVQDEDAEVVQDEDIEVDQDEDAEGEQNEKHEIEIKIEKEHIPFSFKSDEKLYDDFLNKLEKGLWSEAYWFSWALSLDKEIEWDHQMFDAFLRGMFFTPGQFVDYELCEFWEREDIKNGVKQTEHKLFVVGSILNPMLFSQKLPDNIYLQMNMLQNQLKLNIESLDVFLHELYSLVLRHPDIRLSNSDFDIRTQDNDVEHKFEELRHKAQDELDSVPMKRFSYAPADRLLKNLFKQDKPLDKILHGVLENKKEDANKIKNYIDKFNIDAQISDLSQLELANKKTHIDGNSRRKLVREITCVLELGRQWLEIINYSQQDKINERNLLINDLKKIVVKHVPLVRNDINKLISNQSKGLLLSVFKSFDFLLQQLQGLIQGESFQQHLNIGQSLMMYSTLPLDEDFKPKEENVELVIGNLRSTNELIPDEELFKTLLDREEFARAKCLIPDEHEFIRTYDETLDKSLRKIDGQLLDLEKKIEDAFLMGQLSDEDSNDSNDIKTNRDEQVAKIELIRQEINDCKNTRRYLNQELLNNITNINDEMDKVEQRQVNYILSRKEDILSQFHDTDEWISEKEIFLKYFQAALEKRNLVSANDLLDQAEQSIKQNHPQMDYSLPDCNRLSSFEIFEEKHSERLRTEKLLGVVEEIRKHKSPLSLPFATLANYERESSVGAINAIHLLRMKKQFSNNASELVSAICTILDALGFKTDRENSELSDESNSESYYLKIFLQERPKCPVPSFGSELKERLNVVLLKANYTDIDLVAKLKSKRQSESVLIINPNPIKRNLRLKIRSSCAAEHWQMLYADLSVLLYVLAQRNRLPIFFESTLAFSWSAPYQMKGANVYVETFMGRQDEMLTLRDRNGECIVFGGRQLGKSALLCHLTSEYNKPENNDYIIYIDINRLGSGVDSGTTTYEEMLFEFWLKVADELNNVGFLNIDLSEFSFRNRVKFEQIIIKSISEKLNKNPKLELKVFLDETDNLISADSDDSRDFYLIRTIRDLMERNERRIKFVFAGLQSVQMYTRMENHPFAHLGKGIVISPLKPIDAQNLVVKPLNALGFQFKDSNQVRRILAQVNYHPGLIQIFSYRLLENMYKKRANLRRQEKYVSIISDDEIHEIERMPSFRDAIRDRFDWTLDLDDRYKALIYALFLSKSPLEKLTLIDFLSMGKDWWPSEFNNMDLQTMSSLLEEMQGLGVLNSIYEKNSYSYQLRSANLLRLLPRREEMEEEMERIISQNRRRKPNPRNHHTLIDSKNSIFGALTKSQESTLYGSGQLTSDKQFFTLTLLTGSNALGFDGISDNIKHLYSKSDTNWKHVDVGPQYLNSIGRMGDFLSKKYRLTDRPNNYSLIDLRYMPDDISISLVAKELHEKLYKTCKRTSKGHVILLVPPLLNWKFILNNGFDLIDSISRIKLSKLTPWSDGAIWHALERINIKTKAKHLSHDILLKTGGLHEIIISLMAYGKNNQIESAQQIITYLDDVTIQKNLYNQKLLDNMGWFSVLPVLRNVFLGLLEYAEECEPSHTYKIINTETIQLLVEENFEQLIETYDDLDIIITIEELTKKYISWLLESGYIMSSYENQNEDYIVTSLLINVLQNLEN